MCSRTEGRRDHERKIKEGQTERAEVRVGSVWCLDRGALKRSLQPGLRADVLTVSGSMEGEIPTKGGVQILWEIRPFFNISWRPAIYSWDLIPLEGPTFRLTLQAQWAALNWVPALSSSPWQIVRCESLSLFVLLLFSVSVAREKRGMPCWWWCMWEGKKKKKLGGVVDQIW